MMKLAQFGDNQFINVDAIVRIEFGVREVDVYSRLEMQKIAIIYLLDGNRLTLSGELLAEVAQFVQGRLTDA